MNSYDHDRTDEHLLRLKDALQEVHPPREMEASFLCEVGTISAIERANELKVASVKRKRIRYSVAIAASLSIVAIFVSKSTGIYTPVKPAFVIKRTAPNVDQFAGHTYLPITHHSLSKGPELIFQRSQIFHHQSQVRRITYINLRKGASHANQ